MARLVIDTGITPNDGTGDPLKEAFDKTNSNFFELYNELSTSNTALSTRIDNLVISVAGASVLSAEFSSAVNVLDNAISVVSAAVATETTNRTNAISAVSAALQSAVNGISSKADELSLGLVSLNNKIDNIDISALVATSAALQSAIDVVSSKVASNSAQMVSADNALSQAISVISQQVSVLSARVNTNSAQMVSADNSISAAVNVVSNRISAIMTSSQSFTGQTYTFSGNVVNTSSNNGTIVVSGSGGIGVGGNATVGGAVFDSLGNVRNIPSNDKSADYTLLATDNGKHINITSGNITVPNSVFVSGNAVTIYNNRASSTSIIQGAAVTMRQAGTANTGDRTLAQYGLCTVLCVGANSFVISGVGLS